MVFDSEKSFIMAERLKNLREEQGLSHEKLSKALFESYGVKISSDSLINYEVSEANHTKAYKNQGMRVEFLRCLADFYGVSSDYLLGRTKDSSVRPSAVDELGISEGTVKHLAELKIAENQDFAKDAYLFLDNDEFYYFLYQVHLFITSKKAAALYSKIREKIYSKHTKGSSEEIVRNLHEEVKKVVKSGAYSKDFNYTLLRQYQLDIDETSGRDIPQLVRSMYGGASTQNGSQYVTVSDVGEYFVVKSLQKLLDGVLKEEENSLGESALEIQK